MEFIFGALFVVALVGAFFIYKMVKFNNYRQEFIREILKTNSFYSLIEAENNFADNITAINRMYMDGVSPSMAAFHVRKIESEKFAQRMAKNKNQVV
ncbi:hypothetical protein G6694_03660 [Polynucleobacter paneuropaeus]|nr:hypothetical protein [Polynucleobacter paneuropaeus]